MTSPPPFLFVFRYDAEESICQVQDYTFQLGQLFCTSTITIINGYIFYVLFTKKVPSEKNVKLCFWMTMLVCVIFVSTAIVGSTASMFCGTDRTPPSRSANYDNGTQTQRTILDVVYVFPLAVMLVANVLFSCYSVYKIISAVTGPSNGHMIPLLQRLLAFTLAVMCCGIPKFITFFFFDKNELLINISNCCLHSSGWSISLFYFYYTSSQDKSQSQSKVALRQGLTSSSPDDDILSSASPRNYSNSSSVNVSSSEFSREFSVGSEYSRDLMERGSSESAGTASSLPLQIIVNSSS